MQSELFNWKFCQHTQTDTSLCQYYVSVTLRSADDVMLSLNSKEALNSKWCHFFVLTILEILRQPFRKCIMKVFLLKQEKLFYLNGLPNQGVPDQAILQPIWEYRISISYLRITKLAPTEKIQFQSVSSGTLTLYQKSGISPN